MRSVSGGCGELRHARNVLATREEVVEGVVVLRGEVGVVAALDVVQDSRYAVAVRLRHLLLMPVRGIAAPHVTDVW